MNSKSIKFNVALINTCTEAEGPYKRMAIWFQGCTLNCKGCCNPELQDLTPKNIVSFDKLMNIILEAKEQYLIEGVTFLGGEPTIQSHLYDLAIKIREIGLGTILFTGKSMENLDDELVKSVDMIIDGRYDESKRDGLRNLIGSSNRGIHLITNRYNYDLSWFYDNRDTRTEINIFDDLIITGDPVLK